MIGRVIAKGYIQGSFLGGKNVLMVMVVYICEYTL